MSINKQYTDLYKNKNYLTEYLNIIIIINNNNMVVEHLMKKYINY